VLHNGKSLERAGDNPDPTVFGNGMSFNKKTRLLNRRRGTIRRIAPYFDETIGLRMRAEAGQSCFYNSWREGTGVSFSICLYILFFWVKKN